MLQLGEVGAFLALESSGSHRSSSSAPKPLEVVVGPAARLQMAGGHADDLHGERQVGDQSILISGSLLDL